MKISKKDALLWFSFFAQLPEEEEILPRQQEIIYAVLSQIEEAVDEEIARLQGEIPGLKTLDGRTFFVGPEEKFPVGCRSCLLGTGLSAIRKTNRCNLECPFCYNFGELDCQPPIGEGLWEIGGCRYREEDVELLLKASNPPTGISYVYLEPFMEIEKYYGIIRRFHRAGIPQHMYTNGTLATRENLTALAEAGLDELRFNLGASDCHESVLEAMEIAAELLPRVGIETPMTPAFEEQFARNQQRILSSGISFMNCAELHLNPNNIGNYWGEEMYMCRAGYLSPIGSRQITLRLMAQADREQWPIVVHDCSNHTKFARDINLRAKEGGWFGASSYACEFDRIPCAAFLPVLEDPGFRFLQEEELPKGYRPGEIVL